MAGPALIWCPFPDEDSAVAAANALLDEKLAACVNLMPPMTSMFVWRGEKDTVREQALLVKTNEALLDRAIARLAELHPYDEPAVIGWRCSSATPGTLAWLAAIGGTEA